jgi:hypothetical protein
MRFSSCFCAESFESTVNLQPLPKLSYSMLQSFDRLVFALCSFGISSLIFFNEGSEDFFLRSFGGSLRSSLRSSFRNVYKSASNLKFSKKQ